MPTSCCAVGCTSRHPNFKLFAIPSGKNDQTRRKLWLIRISRKNFHPNISTRLCEKHFADDQFEKNFYKKLKPNACPTIFQHRLYKNQRTPTSYIRRNGASSVKTISNKKFPNLTSDESNILAIPHSSSNDPNICRDIHLAATPGPDCDSFPSLNPDERNIPTISHNSSNDSNICSDVHLVKTDPDCDGFPSLTGHNIPQNSSNDPNICSDVHLVKTDPDCDGFPSLTGHNIPHSSSNDPNICSDVHLAQTPGSDYDGFESKHNILHNSSNDPNIICSDVHLAKTPGPDCVGFESKHTIPHNSSNDPNICSDVHLAKTPGPDSDGFPSLTPGLIPYLIIVPTILNNSSNIPNPSPDNFSCPANKNDILSNSKDLNLIDQVSCCEELRRKLNAAYNKISKLNAEKKTLSNSIERLFTEDQINALQHNNVRNNWSVDTIEKALKIRKACGSKGYNYLLDSGYPLPSVRSLQRRTSKLSKGECHN